MNDSPPGAATTEQAAAAFDPSELVALGEQVVAHARPGEQIEVVLGHSVDTEVRAYDGDVESFVSATSAGVGIRVVADSRQGFAVSGSLDVDAVFEALADARDNASFATPDPFLGLPGDDGVEPATVDLFDPALLRTGPAAKIELARALEAATLAADPRMVGVESAEYADTIAAFAIVSTEGISRVTVESICSLVSSSLAGSGDEVTTGFGYSIGRRIEDLSVERAAGDSAMRAVRMLGAGRVPTARVTVVLEPWVTAQLLGIIVDCFSAESVLKGRSPFGGRLGETVASPLVTLVDDATDVRAFGATAIDGEGLATRRVGLIGGGVADAWLHDSRTGRQMSVASTGSAVRAGFRSTPAPGAMAARLVGGVGGADDVMRSVGEGILVSEVQGLHSGVNPVSGDFSTGIEGFVIRDGQRGEPIREVTIASTLQRMLTDVVCVADDTDWCPMNAAGCTLAIADVTVSGQ